jgi:hypothetical protein
MYIDFISTAQDTNKFPARVGEVIPSRAVALKVRRRRHYEDISYAALQARNIVIKQLLISRDASILKYGIQVLKGFGHGKRV